MQMTMGPPTSRTPRAPVLRDYQTRAIQQLGVEFVANGRRAPILVQPTGAGKTVVAAELIRRCQEKGRTALFLAPRRELVQQTSEKLHDVGVEHGIIQAGNEDRLDTSLAVQVASVDTLLSRVLRRKSLSLEPPELVFVDECHLAISKTRKELFDLWPDACRIGLTATPTRKDGRALSTFYDALVEPVTTRQLTEQGYLAPARYFSVAEPDLAGVKTTAGDWNSRQLDEKVNRPKLIGDVVTHWLEHARTRRTVVFATSIAHSLALAEEFVRVGVAAEHVDANTQEDARAATFDRFRSGQTEVLTNCFLASYGFDLPALSCVVLARPTKSLMLYLQMLGRALRTAPGKEDALILDHSGAVRLHGFATDERLWTLDGRDALAESEHAAPADEDEERKITVCPECGAMFRRTNICPECGFELRRKPAQVAVAPGQLVPVGDPGTVTGPRPAQFYAELMGVARERGWKPGWAAYKYREAFGQWPPKDIRNVAAAYPTESTRRWVKARQIAWARRKRYAEQAQQQRARGE